MKIGLQLYSLREEMEKDIRATLKAVKDMGYDCVEFAGYYNYDVSEIKRLMEEIGLTCPSVHQKYDVYLSSYEEYLKILKILGAKYSAIPWMEESNLPGGESHEKAVQDIKNIGEKLKKDGICQLYHNHDFEFKLHNGKTKLQGLFEKIGEELIFPEFDVCWITYAGYNPCEWILKYSGKVPIVHLKDFKCSKYNAGPQYGLIGSSKSEKANDKSDFEFVPLGEGSVDFDKVLEAVKKTGTEYLIVEQDRPTTGKTPMECAKISREFLKSKGL